MYSAIYYRNLYHIAYEKCFNHTVYTVWDPRKEGICFLKLDKGIMCTTKSVIHV